MTSTVFPQPISRRESNTTAFYRVIVLIKSDTQKGSGILVKDDKLGYIFMTVKHVVTPGAIAYIEGAEISLDCLKSYESGSDILLFILGDILDYIFENQNGSIPMTLANAQLQIGEKVYFGGYPFKKTDAHLNRGHLSCISQDGKFSIDGVAVAGMSGGPIAVEREGKLYVIGTIASETFDPIEGFSRALDKMYCDQNDMQVRQDFTQGWRQEAKESMLRDPQFTKITKGNLYISWLNPLTNADPDCFIKMWDDLNKAGVISDDGGVDSEKIIPGQLGLREEYQQFESDIIKLLRARTTDLIEMDPERIQLPFETENLTDSVNTVGLSLVQSLSTGLITGHLLQEYQAKDLSIQEQESTEFEIGKTSRVAKNTKNQKDKACKLRAEAKQSGSFVNIGIPPILYRFVSNDAAKNIKKNDGIIRLGEALDEIPFLTKPLQSMAISVGAKPTDRLVTVFTDKIPALAKENVRRVSERNGVCTYRINLSIPKEAIEISEA